MTAGGREKPAAIARGIKQVESGLLPAVVVRGQGKIELYAELENKFFTLEDALELTFQRDPSGVVTGIASNQGWRAKRIQSD